MANDKEFLGQVWTPNFIVNKMIDLITIKDPQLILEPSSGSGRFYFSLKEKYQSVIGVELDAQIAHQNAIIKSYFETNYQADVIIGNPPYVEFKNIQNRPQTKLLIHKPNLFHYFLEKALNDLKPNGELIWIIPSNIFTNTSSKALNEIIYQNYSITYWEEVKENVWENAAIATAIVKIVKTKNHPDQLDYFFSNGKIIFGPKIKTTNLVNIKVGGASGFNKLLEKGEVDFINSQTERTKKTIAIKYEPKKWIRPTPKAPQGFTYQIFVNCKTRKINPFYMLDQLKKSEFINYDASVLCIYTFGSKTDAINLMNQLNQFNWSKAGIKKDGRFHFSQSILKAILN